MYSIFTKDILALQACYHYSLDIKQTQLEIVQGAVHPEEREIQEA